MHTLKINGTSLHQPHRQCNAVEITTTESTTTHVFPTLSFALLCLDGEEGGGRWLGEKGEEQWYEVVGAL
jgi:hypothetical protein